MASPRIILNILHFEVVEPCSDLIHDLFRAQVSDAAEGEHLGVLAFEEAMDPFEHYLVVEEDAVAHTVNDDYVAVSRWRRPASAVDVDLHLRW